MNWFTRDNFHNASLAAKKEALEKDGGCEHAEADPNVIAYVRYERDSCGPVSSYAVCEACDKKAEEEEGNEMRKCADCKKDVPFKDGIEWKWYDFYAAQGDVALFICNCCKREPKHRQRVADDRHAYEQEFPDGC